MTMCAAPMGNYRGYYSMRSIPPKERLNGLHRDWIYNRSCLDIGCNSGHVTFYLAQHFLPKSMLGIDIDPALIHRARERLMQTASAMENSLSHCHGALAAASSLKLRNPTFMPRSVRLAVEAKPVFPQNLSFMVQDVMMLGRGIAKSDSLESGHSPSTYGSIFCLSLTKWIHLNYGDEGLLRFFRILHRLLDPDGYLILEFQSWQSYINNKNTSSITKQVFKSIQIKPEQFESELVRLGFEVVQRLGTPVEVARGFNRPILVLQRTGSGSCAADTHAAAEATDESNAKDERDAGEKGSTERVCDQVEVERGDDADVCVDISTGIGEEEGAESPRKRKRKSKKDRKHKKDRQERE